MKRNANIKDSIMMPPPKARPKSRSDTSEELRRNLTESITNVSDNSALQEEFHKFFKENEELEMRKIDCEELSISKSNSSCNFLGGGVGNMQSPTCLCMVGGATSGFSSNINTNFNNFASGINTSSLNNNLNSNFNQNIINSSTNTLNKRQNSGINQNPIQTTSNMQNYNSANNLNDNLQNVSNFLNNINNLSASKSDVKLDQKETSLFKDNSLLGWTNEAFQNYLNSSKINILII